MSDNTSVDRRLDIFGVHFDRPRSEVDELFAEGRLLRVSMAADTIATLLGIDGMPCRARGHHLVQSEAPFHGAAQALVDRWTTIARGGVGAEGLKALAKHYRPGSTVQLRYTWQTRRRYVGLVVNHGVGDLTIWERPWP